MYMYLHNKCNSEYAIHLRLTNKERIIATTVHP